MAEMKFKHGDKVRITGEVEDATDHLHGKVGTVTKVFGEDIEVKVPGEKFPWLIWKYNAELVKEEAEPEEVTLNGFKVGDRVNVGGTKGTIICITEYDMFGVQFDDEEFAGHRCMGVKLKAGKPSPRKDNCWWVKPENVTSCENKNRRYVCMFDTRFIFDDGEYVGWYKP